jgi:predicted ATPase
MTHLTDLTAEEVYDYITKYPWIRKHDSSIIIMGRPGKTGKSFLCRRLLNNGYIDVTEISEKIAGLVTYNDNNNHILINEVTGDTIVVLNNPL